ncbi:MAG: SufS family cysteine desulfurase, partial [Candidatus Doudnabacteria bacterium]|nr:SufS family cysteine desulfurase [Candidatus Doudnabacteria bacterium]
MFNSNFPILKRKINGRRLVYLDNASTTQKPQNVILAMTDFYEHHNANIHRGIHTLSQEATQMYEGARDKVQKFINAKYREEIIFTSGATEAINLVVWTWGHENIKRGDEILLTEMEHHSNLVPWQILARKKGAKLKFIPLNETWNLKLETLNKLITRRTKMVALTHISNVLGTVNPVEKIIKAAHKKGAMVLIDGAQAGGHISVDVQKLGADFYVLSGHKMYGPTGVGVLYGRKEILENMPPYQSGGHMIRSVDWQNSTWNDLPWKLEAGTANIADVIGLGAAIDFINKVGLRAVKNHELRIMNYVLRELGKISGIEIYGPESGKDRIGVISFNAAGVPPHDLASILDQRGIAIRTGHHCAMPL